MYTVRYVYLAILYITLVVQYSESNENGVTIYMYLFIF